MNRLARAAIMGVYRSADAIAIAGANTLQNNKIGIGWQKRVQLWQNGYSSRKLSSIHPQFLDFCGRS